LELSSFQLDDIQTFRPKIAILLNITPDHLDRYEYQLEKYAAAKFRVTLNQGKSDKFIYNGFDPILKENRVESAAKAIAIRKGFCKNGLIKIGKHVFDLNKSNLRGPHNMFNATCALRAALLLRADAAKLQSALESFVTPPHRLEKVAEIGGVTWINDSKATNVDSVFYALQAMDKPTVWIAGGTDKGNDYGPILKLVKQKVKAMVWMGVDNSKLFKTFRKYKKPMLEAKSAAEAVQAAAKLAEKGDTVLLSPACASFDLFKNYEDRGTQFREQVIKRLILK
jgi:UDP-N-acetylmuramoylalanine--D-glutamate ligase